MLNFSRKPAKSLTRLELAKIGEEAATRLLAAKGYKILERNFRSRGGEIDIIARQKLETVFVEVKSRTGEEFGTPAQSVGKTKQQKLARLAENYIASHFGREVCWRFDIVEVWLTPQGKIQKINIIPEAFRPGE